MWALSNVSPIRIQRHESLTLTNPQLVLVASVLAGNRVSETFTSSDFTVAKGYLVFVLVFVAFTSIIVSTPVPDPTHQPNKPHQIEVLAFNVVPCNPDVYGLNSCSYSHSVSLFLHVFFLTLSRTLSDVYIPNIIRGWKASWASRSMEMLSSAVDRLRKETHFTNL